MTQKPSNTGLVHYRPPKDRYGKIPKKSIAPIGMDTEADITGKCFMICTSIGDVWTREAFPACMFDTAHRDRAYVCYNLKYDMGALLQGLPREHLEELRQTGRTTYDGYRYRVITNKYLGIVKSHQSIQIYDIMTFYGGRLDDNAYKYLGEGKIQENTRLFQEPYISTNWQHIAKYCIRDAELTARLAARLIGQFETWGLTVKKLYSTAYVSYQWFAAKCGHPSVGYLWYNDRHVLDYAMASYKGGKFEITTKGTGYLYEYDIASAYPHSISNLLDLTGARVVWSIVYRRQAVYAFIDCTVKIPYDLPSPVAVKRVSINTFPTGIFRAIITKQEYDYLVANGADATIHNACWIHIDKKTYPYRKEINRLYTLKSELKNSDDPLAYHTVKILMNSLYGKFVQLIDMGEYWQAGASWNPIYASVITAETRVKITEIQRLYQSIWGVHTDSVISDRPLPFSTDTTLGAISYECEGKGMIAGCGVYQIGDKTALRGVPSNIPLMTLAGKAGRTLDISRKGPYSWRQILSNGWDLDKINEFQTILKSLSPNMDKKRLWWNDAETWVDLLQGIYYSEPLQYSPLFYPQAC